MRGKVFIFILILALVVMTGGLLKMYTLPYWDWSYWSLLYFLGLWGLFTILIGYRFKYETKDWKLQGLPIAAAFLLSVGFPPYPIIGASFLGFSFFLIHRHRSQEYHYRRRRYNWQLFTGLWLWNILTTFWVENTLFFSGLIANVLNALLMMIPFIIYGRVEKFIPSKWVRYFGFISFWICYEYLHLNWEISWHWLILGHQFAHVPAIIQWYEYTGVLGGTLWILVVSFMLFEVWKSNQGFSFEWKKYRSIIAVIALPILISIIRFYQYTPVGEEAEVLVVQPNYNPHVDQDIPKNEYLKGYLDLVKFNISEKTKFVLLPESAIKRLRLESESRNSMVVALKEIVDQYPNATIISGASTDQVWGTDKPTGEDYRTHVRDNGEKIYWQHYNSALAIDSSGLNYYYKSKFVPGAEVVPYPDIFWIIKPLADALGGSLDGMGTQETRTAFANGEISMAPVICYESVYGEYASRYVTEGGAQALGIVTIDGWWDNTAGHLQHLYLGALRAVELRKDIARSAVSGISGFIDQRGVVIKRSEYETSAALKHSVQFNEEVTFYMKWGDLIGRLAIFMALIAIFNAIRVYYERAKKI